MGSTTATRSRHAGGTLVVLLACACQSGLAATVDILPERYPNRLGPNDDTVSAVLLRPPQALGISHDARAHASSADGSSANVEGTLELLDVDGDGGEDAVVTFAAQALREAGIVSASAHRVELRVESQRESWVGSDRLFDGDASLIVLPAPLGPYGVGTAELVAVDGSRVVAGAGGRTLLVRLWYPAVTSARQPAPYFLDVERAERSQRAFYLPLPDGLFERTHGSARQHLLPAAPEPRAAVLLSPGWDAPVELYGALAAELASFGYLVVGVQHPGGPGALGGDDGAPNPEDWELVPSERTSAAWALDLEYVAAWLENPDEAASTSLDEAARADVRDALAQLDRGRVAALGHCFGGSAAVRADADSSRIGASIALESSILGEPRALAQQAHSLLLSSPEHAELDASLDAFLVAAGTRSRGLDIVGTRYADYADTRWLFSALLREAPDLGAEGYGLGPIGAERAHVVISAQVRAFLAAAWSGQPASAELRAADYPEVTPRAARAGAAGG